MQMVRNGVKRPLPDHFIYVLPRDNSAPTRSATRAVWQWNDRA